MHLPQPACMAMTKLGLGLPLKTSPEPQASHLRTPPKAAPSVTKAKSSPPRLPLRSTLKLFRAQAGREEGY